MEQPNTRSTPDFQPETPRDSWDTVPPTFDPRVYPPVTPRVNRAAPTIIANTTPTTFDFDASPFDCWRATCVRDLQILRPPRKSYHAAPPNRLDVLLTLRENDRITRQVLFCGERTSTNDEPFVSPHVVGAESRLILPYNDTTGAWPDIVCVEESRLFGSPELAIVYIGALPVVRYLARHYGGEYLKLNAVRGSWTSRPYKFNPQEVSDLINELPSVLAAAFCAEYEPPRFLWDT